MIIKLCVKIISQQYNKFLNSNLFYMFSQRSMNALFSQIKIHFCIHKQVDFGRAVYVSGNLSEIGCWKIDQSLRLQWNEDHYWSGTVTIPAYIYDSFSFKYVVANYRETSSDQLQWQHGNNRKIVIQNDKRCIVCNHKWNKQKITLNLCIERAQQMEQYYVVGNISELGRWKINNRMKRQKVTSSQNILKEDVRNKKQLKPVSSYKAIYSFTFYMYKGRESFQYLFIRKGQNIEVQRYPGRIWIQQKENNCHNRLGTFYSNANIQIFDKNSFNQLRISNITEYISVGSYLKSSEDIKMLKQKGITDILSIQTQEDYVSHNLSYKDIKKACQQAGINYHQSDIQDKNPQDFVKKALKTFLKMQSALKSKGKIYVHCSAGIYRSPQIIALYLILVQQYTIQSAIQTIKQRHPFAKPNYIVICSAVDQILCRHYKGNKKISL